jgi:hypothetical protein
MRETSEEYSFEDYHSGIEQIKHPVLAVTCRAGIFILNLHDLK